MLIRMYCTCHEDTYVRMYVHTCVHTYACTYVQISVLFVTLYVRTYMWKVVVWAQSVKISTIFAHFTLLYVYCVHSKSANVISQAQ